MKYILGISGGMILALNSAANFFSHHYSDVEKQANEYFPVQSPSEVAAGHPLVGVS